MDLCASLQSFLHAVPTAAWRCVSPCPSRIDYDSEDFALRRYSSEHRAAPHVVRLERCKVVAVYDGDTITVVARAVGTALGRTPLEYKVSARNSGHTKAHKAKALYCFTCPLLCFFHCTV